MEEIRVIRKQLDVLEENINLAKIETAKLKTALEEPKGGFFMSWQEDFRLTENFVMSEFYSKDRYPLTVVEEKLVKMLQQLRNEFEVPVIVISGYRSVAHNNSKAVGGAIDSYHQRGMAADIRINGVSLVALAKEAEKVGFTGIDIYETFVHVDTRQKKWRGPGWVRQIGG